MYWSICIIPELIVNQGFEHCSHVFSIKCGGFHKINLMRAKGWVSPEDSLTLLSCKLSPESCRWLEVRGDLSMHESLRDLKSSDVIPCFDAHQILRSTQRIPKAQYGRRPRIWHDWCQIGHGITENLWANVMALTIGWQNWMSFAVHRCLWFSLFLMSIYVYMLRVTSVHEHVLVYIIYKYV